MSENSPETSDLKTNGKPNSRKEKALKNLGDLAVTGGPGRPPGLKNKFTRIKEDICNIFFDKDAVDGKEFRERLQEMARKKPAKFIDVILTLLPKEVHSKTKVEVTQKTFFYEMAKRAGLVIEEEADEATRIKNIA